MIYLLLDVSDLAYRNFHAIGELSHDGVATQVPFGVFRDILDLQDLFGTVRIAFCFDGGHDGRTNLYPRYKRRDIDMTEEERDARRSLRQQIYRLRTKYLPVVGFRNIFWQEGYEADDLIAWIVENIKGHDYIIVSRDQDLYQLLSPTVSIWNVHAKKAVTEQSFREDFGIGPAQWPDVKAMAGCGSDNVEGIHGVGEKTAAKFLSGRLKDSTQAYAKIVANNDIWRRNLQLVSLPFPGVNPVELRDDEVTTGSWRRVMKELGMSSLIGRL